MSSQLILASESAARRRLLKRLGLKFKAIAPSIDESAFQKKIKSPQKLVRVLAEEKARAVAQRFPRAVVIGSDQMLVLGNKVFGKPITEENACKQLQMCSGKWITLITGVAILGTSKTGKPVAETFVHSTKMKFRKLSETEIKAYVRLDQPLWCAGSFMFEKRGISLFHRLETDDPSAIEGFPLLYVNEVLRANFPDLFVG